MTDAPVDAQRALSDSAARQLANATKTRAQLETISPRWLTRLLHWVPVEAGIYRLNQRAEPGRCRGGLPAAQRIGPAADVRRLRRSGRGSTS